MSSRPPTFPRFTIADLAEDEIRAIGQALAEVPYTELELIARPEIRDRVRRACLAGLSPLHRDALVQIPSLSGFARAVRDRYRALPPLAAPHEKAPPEGGAYRADG